MQRTTSLYLDLLRILAAAVVFAGHAYPQRLTGGLPALWHFGSIGNDAVMLFFVLSGFVIAYVADQRELTLKSYSISRLARLYSVVVPALALTVVLDAIGSRLTPGLYDAAWFATDNPLWRIGANALFVNELWFISVRPFSNVPFWSLGYEFWYYAIFAAAFYLHSWHRYVAVAATILVAGPKILLLLPVWLLGVWAYYISKAQIVSERVGTTLAVGSVACVIAFRVYDLPGMLNGVATSWIGPEAVEQLGFSKAFLSSYVVGSLTALHLLGISAISHHLDPLMPERPIRTLASFTFALYLFHYPLLFFLAAIAEWIGAVEYRSLLVPIGTLIVVWALGQLTERRKSAVRRWVSTCYEAVAQSGRGCIAAVKSTYR